MPFYNKLDATKAEDKRTIERLLRLRQARGEQGIPERTLRENLLLATWNIRDFDRPAYGDRMQEAIYYIAEIISWFDIVAIQEVYRDLGGLERVMEVLGGHWAWVFADATEGDPGNDERLAFVYDTRKIKFGGLAGELVLPDIEMPDGTKARPKQLARTPYICGFRAGWSKFMLVTVHITWGVDTAEPPERIEEIRQVAEFLKERTLDESAWARSLILLGDFNIFQPDNKTFKQLLNAGFEIPDELQARPSNAPRTRHYDQIAFRVRENHLDRTGNAGVFNFYDYVYRLDDQKTYIPDMGDSYDTTSKGNPRTESGKKTYYRTYWRTQQMSDHLPMWVELRIDYSDEYLEYKLGASG